MILWYVKSLYIFNYGAPIAVIYIDNKAKRITIYTSFDDDKIIKGMVTVASLIKRYHSQKFFTIKYFTGYMGQEYIVVAHTRNPIFSPPILGFLMYLTKKLDSIGASTIDNIVAITIETLREKDGNDFKIFVK